MSAVDELLKNLMQRAGIKKSKKRARETDGDDKTFLPCRNTKTRQELSDTDSLSSEVKSTRPEANNC